jgi:diguanylate cyclase
VALLAVDDFETLDAQHGQGASEAALDHVAALCNETLRASDHVGRWDDNELLLLLPDTSRAQALVTIERLLQALRGQGMVSEAWHVDITASAGVAESSGEDSAQIIIHRADIARHLARSNGRGRVEAG